MLLGILGASLLGNLLRGKWLKQSKMPGRGLMQTSERTSWSWAGFLLWPHPLNIFEKQKSRKCEYKNI